VGALTDFPATFLRQGAAAVVASTAPTVDRLYSLGPAGHFGRVFVRGLLGGATVGESLDKTRGMFADGFVFAGDGGARLA